jgi:archaellum biogenesis ATPase FlaH
MNLIDLKEYEGEDKIISSHEMRSIVKGREEFSVTYKSNFKGLDEALEGGFQNGELYSISGPTKNGKTLFAQTLTNNLYSQQIFSLWFTYELPPKQFLNCFPDLPLIYMPAKLKSANMEWLLDRIVESYLKYNTRFVFIDHLHYLFDMAKSRNPSIEIGQVIRKLKLLAVEHGLVLFLMCHTGKVSPEKVSYSSIRDSSFVSQESDSVFIIVRTPKTRDKSILRVEFHRRTGVLEHEVRFIKENGFLREDL